MIKMKVPSGTRQSLETVFDNVQSYMFDNLSNRVNLLFGDSYGQALDLDQGSLSTNSTGFAVSVNASTNFRTKIQILPGTIYFSNGEYYKTTDILSASLSSSVGSLTADTYYLVELVYNELGSEPIAAQSSFVYDTTSSAPYSQKNTKFSDNVTITFTELTYGSTSITASAGRLPLAIVKIILGNDGNLWLQSGASWSYTDGTTTYTPTATGEVDLRASYLLRLNSNLYDETKLVLKDRDNTGARKMTGSLEVAGNVLTSGLSVFGTGYFSGNVTISGLASSRSFRLGAIHTTASLSSIFDFVVTDHSSSIGKLSISPATYNRDISFKDKDGNPVLVIHNATKNISIGSDTDTHTLHITGDMLLTGAFTPGSIASAGNIASSGIISAASMQVGGVDVKTDAGTPNNINNFRIYDVTLTNDPNEKMAYLWLKWNWDAILPEAIAYDTGLVTLPTALENTNGEGFDTQGDFRTSTLVNKKYLQFWNGDKFLITNYDSTNKQFTINTTGLKGNAYGTYTSANPVTLDSTAHSFNATHLCDIVDGPTTTGYRIKINETGSAEKASRSIIYDLDRYQVRYPSYSAKLELENTYAILAQAVNINNDGILQTMYGSSYDPDHVSGGQTPITYNIPYRHTLPNISTEGAVSLTSTNFGFNINLTGWQVAGDASNTAQEFEVAYTNLATVDFNDTLETTHIITKDRFIPVTANSPNTWSVAARPLQNKQVVGAIAVNSVVAGGGGVPPTDLLLATIPFNVMTASGILTSTPDVNSFATFTETGGEFFGSDALNGMAIDVTISGGSTLSGRIIDNTLYNDSGMAQKLALSDTTGVLSGDAWNTGTSLTGRLIEEIDNLPIDYIITNIAISVKSITGISAGSPGVIRAYQYGNSSNYVALEINGVGAVVDTSANLEITSSVTSPRKIVIDAWDPTAVNNACSMSGTILIWARPIVAASGAS